MAITKQEIDEILKAHKSVVSKTIFLDIDGSILYHRHDLEGMLGTEPEILPGVGWQLTLWSRDGTVVILTSARPESSRARTIEQLETVGIRQGEHFRDLILGITAGERWLINDQKPHQSVTARAFSIPRNKGLDFS
jgi:hypothetical protein